jgi:hypothetical protein
MTPQTPAKGIMQISDHRHSQAYRVACECREPQHEHTVFVEADDDVVLVNIYTTQHTNYWCDRFRYDYTGQGWLRDVKWTATAWANSLVRKIKLTWTLWTRGTVRYEATIMLSPQAAANYAQALTQAAKDLRSTQRA